jgi:hypothetical protein
MMEGSMLKSLSIALFSVGIASVVLCHESTARDLAPQERAEKYQQLRQYEVGRQDYARREARARGIERGLVAGATAGEIADGLRTANKFRAPAGMSSRQWVGDYGRPAARDLGKGYIGNRLGDKALEYVFDRPQVAPYNYRMWKKLGVVQ